MPDPRLNVALRESIANLPVINDAFGTNWKLEKSQSDQFHRQKLYAELLVAAITRMKLRGLKWPALLDSFIVAAGRFQSFHAQECAFLLLR